MADQVDQAARTESEPLQQRALATFCDRYIAETGPWTREDESEIARILQLLGR